MLYPLSYGGGVYETWEKASNDSTQVGEQRLNDRVSSRRAR